MDADELAQVYEMTLAMAQSTICEAIKRAGIRRSELARRLGVTPPHITQMLQGGYNMSLEALSRTLAATGYEVRFTLVKRPPHRKR